MAIVAMARSQHIGVLGDVTSFRVNTHRTQPFIQRVARVAPNDTCTPFREKHIQRGLSSPHPAHLLSLNGYYIGENHIIRKDPNCKMAPSATEQKVPSTSTKSTSPTSTVASHTHPTSVPIADAFPDLASSTDAQPQVAAAQATVDMSSLPSNPSDSASVSYKTRFLILLSSLRAQDDAFAM
jgi:hypothetical protein